MNFEGKVAIVTGGGSGIGREVVLKLAGLGAKVAVVDIEEESAEKVALEVREGGGEVLVVKADISDYDQVLGMAKGVYERFGRIDVLVNNAAWDKIQLFMETTPELWYKLIDVNLKGPIHVRFGRVVVRCWW